MSSDATEPLPSEQVTEQHMADLLVASLGLEAAIHACRVYAWDGVLKCVIVLKETDEGDTNSA